MMVDNILGVPSKIRKFDNDSSNFIYSNVILKTQSDFLQNSNFIPNFNEPRKIPVTFHLNCKKFSRSLERLKLKTIPQVTTLVEMLVKAKNINMNALRSIEQINKKITEIEFLANKNIIEMANITSPLSSTRSSSGEALKSNQLMNSEDENHIFSSLNNSQKSFSSHQNGPIIDLTIEDHSLKSKIEFSQDGFHTALNKNGFYNNLQENGNLLTSLPNVSIVAISSFYLPKDNLSSFLNAPKLAWKSVKGGICLQWDMLVSETNPQPTMYHIYSFQKPNMLATISFPWKKIGEVDALPLPMACTLTQVVKMCNYFFAVRASIQNQTFGPWSNVVLAEIH